MSTDLEKRREFRRSKLRSVYKPALDLKVGDVVRKFYGQQVLSPYMGQITNVVPPLGVADVEWPFGNRREDAYFLAKINMAQTTELPIVFGDSSYSSYDNPKL